MHNKHCIILPGMIYSSYGMNHYENCSLTFLLVQDRDSQKTEWIDRCIEELRSDTWVLPALKQIKEICSLFYEVFKFYFLGY